MDESAAGLTDHHDAPNMEPIGARPGTERTERFLLKQGAPSCVRLLSQVRLVISEKGLVCEERDVSLPLQEHKEPWFMRLNLGEEVPVFLHGDTIISDYNQIIDYLEKTFVGGK